MLYSILKGLATELLHQLHMSRHLHFYSHDFCECGIRDIPKNVFRRQFLDHFEDVHVQSEVMDFPKIHSDNHEYQDCNSCDCKLLITRLT